MENIQYIEYVKTITKRGDSIMYSSLQNIDNNSCAVGALVACFDITFDHAQSFARDFWNRVPNKGTMTRAIVKTMRDGTVGQVFNKKISVLSGDPHLFKTYKCYGKIVKRRMTIKSFIQKYNTGTYYVLISNHALAVKDGVLYDTNINGNLKKRCIEAYKIEEI